ncbi:MAG TPA: serine hydrolase [Ruminococcus sp.]|nr:serine hydrolase [Ruminococcus sp.]
MNQKELHTRIAESVNNESNICQICAFRDGEPVYQDNWHGFEHDSAMNVMSVTKGIMALLFGIAADQGYISDPSEKVLTFFPDYTVKRGEKTIYDVTLAHLLTMTAPYKYRSEPWKKVCTSDDWTKAALDLLGGRAGITGAFKYATLGIQILAGVIEQASGMKCIDLANQYLFAPLDIPASVLHGDSSKEDQFDFLMNKQPRKHEWYSDPAGRVTAGWGLTLSATDMAKIGWMLLNDGSYHGKQILSKAWITKMTAPLQQLDERFGNLYYGYLWYRPDPEKPVFAAIGDSGNIIYANQEKRISVGITGTFKPRIYDRIAFIEQQVLPMIEQM